jgi:hypothetical protein
MERDIKYQIIKIFANDIDSLILCVRKYTTHALITDDILLSAGKNKTNKINEIKNILLVKEAKFRTELLQLKIVLLNFINK